MKTLLIALVVVLTLPVAWLESEPPGVMPNVTVAGTQVEGMSFRNLRTYCRKRAQTLRSSGNLRLVVGSSAFTVPFRCAGIDYSPDTTSANAYLLGRELEPLTRLRSRLKLARGINLEMHPTVDSNRLQRILAQAIVPPRDASAEVEHGIVHILPDSPGERVDIGKSIVAIEAALNAGQDTVRLPALSAMADTTAGDLNGVSAVRAQARIPVTSPFQAAWSNALLACRAIDGIVVKAGDICSVNHSIGVRSTDKGYMPAPVFIDGKADTAVGGGICCLASGVFRCIVLGGLDLIESHQHAKVVNYATPGLDSTLAWGQKDLRFRNNTKHAVVIRARADTRSRSVEVQFLGEPNTNRISLSLKRSYEGNRLIVHTYRNLDGVPQLLRVSIYPIPGRQIAKAVEGTR